MLWAKSFQTFECFNPLSRNPTKNPHKMAKHTQTIHWQFAHAHATIPHAIFETTRSRFIQILHHCSVSRKITPLYIFLAQVFIVTKTAHRSENLPNFSSHVLKYKSVFLKLYVTLQCHKR